MRVLYENMRIYASELQVFCLLRGRGYQLCQAGFSLIELIITIAIMGIVTGIATLSFNSWQTKNNIESQTREIYADLADARTRALTQKKVHGIIFKPKNYVMKSYSSEVEYNYPNDAPVNNGEVIFTKTLKFGITKTNTSTVFTDYNAAILFDTTGFASTIPSTSTFGFTIVVNPVNVSSNLNCLVISAARVNMGKWNETTAVCEFK